MNRILITSILIIFCHFTFAQVPDLMKEMVENDLQIRQKPGSDNLLQKYLSTLNAKEDTLYAILYSPMDCPRCEVAIPNFFRMLKKVDTSNHKFLLITAYKDSTMAAIYNQKNDYQADYYLYDTHNKYKQIFSFNSNGLYGLHILKICKSSGRMLIGGQYTLLNMNFIRQLLAISSPIDYHLYESEGVSDEKEFTARTPKSYFIQNDYTDYRLDYPKTTMISNVYDVMRFEGDKFFYSDVLNNGVLCFNKTPGINKLEFNMLIQADSIEKRKYIDLPEDIYQQQQKNNMFFYIACGTNLLDKEHIAVSYSLPQVFMEDSNDGSTNIAYYNSPAIISRNSLTKQHGPFIPLDFNLYGESFFYMHFNYSVSGNQIILGCKKLTWPMEFEPEEYKDNIMMNPFCEEFYDTENPILAVFDKNTGKLIKRFGQLEECQKKSRTGYYYSNPLSCTHGKEILYTNGLTGQLYITSNQDVNKVKEHFSLFEVESEKFPPADSIDFYKYEYVKPYNQFFDRCIEDIKLTKTHIYCLVRYGAPDAGFSTKDEYTFATINRKNHQIKEFRLPHYLGYEILGYGLKNDRKGHIQPFGFFKSKESFFIRVFTEEGK